MVHGIEEVCLSTIHNIWPMLTNGSRLGNRDKHHIDMSQSPERTMKAWWHILYDRNYYKGTVQITDGLYIWYSI